MNPYPKPKQRKETSASSSESEYSDSSDSSYQSSDGSKDGLKPEGNLTPILPANAPAAHNHAEELETARKSQQKLSELSAKTPEAAQPPEPALKVPASPVVALLSSMNATYKALPIPKKSQMIANADKKLKPSKHRRRAAKKAAKNSKKHKKHPKTKVYCIYRW